MYEPEEFHPSYYDPARRSEFVTWLSIQPILFDARCRWYFRYLHLYSLQYNADELRQIYCEDYELIDKDERQISPSATD